MKPYIPSSGPKAALKRRIWRFCSRFKHRVLSGHPSSDAGSPGKFAQFAHASVCACIKKILHLVQIVQNCKRKVTNSENISHKISGKILPLIDITPHVPNIMVLWPKKNHGPMGKPSTSALPAISDQEHLNTFFSICSI